jgi:predicted nucleotidyltransferase
MSHTINLIRIKAVYHALDELKETIAFVGGATVSLYADKPEQTDVRPTNDIDVLIEIGSYGNYIRIQEKLAKIGFHVDPEAKITCRYKYQGLIVDIMPTEESVLGFSNIWYREGFSNLIAYQVDERTKVNIFSPAYFIASKLEAFKGRGNSDGRTSHDFEDIVFVLDNRKSIWQELDASEQYLRNYLTGECQKLISNKNIEEWISVHLEYETAITRARMILRAMAQFVTGKTM